EVLHRIIERPRLDERFVDMRQRPCRQKRVAVWLTAPPPCRTNRCTAAANVLDDDRTEKRLHFLRPRPSDEVVCPARGERGDEPDLPRRIRLRPRHARHVRQRTCARE